MAENRSCLSLKGPLNQLIIQHTCLFVISKSDPFALIEVPDKGGVFKATSLMGVIHVT